MDYFVFFSTPLFILQKNHTICINLEEAMLCSRCKKTTAYLYIWEFPLFHFSSPMQRFIFINFSSLLALRDTHHINKRETALSQCNNPKKNALQITRLLLVPFSAMELFKKRSPFRAEKRKTGWQTHTLKRFTPFPYNTICVGIARDARAFYIIFDATPCLCGEALAHIHVLNDGLKAKTKRSGDLWISAIREAGNSNA